MMAWTSLGDSGAGWGSVGEQLGCAGARRGTEEGLGSRKPQGDPLEQRRGAQPTCVRPRLSGEGSSQICSPEEAEAEWEGIARSVRGVGPRVLFGHLLGVRSCVRGTLR